MNKAFETAIVEGRKVIDFHIHPYRNIGESLCMYSEDFYLTPEEARLDLERAGIGKVCGSVIRYGLLASAVKTVGADRILFGTDYPISNPRMYVQAVLGEHISEEDMEQIFFRNAEKLLG